MITLDVEDYCQDCPYFRATSETVQFYTNEKKEAVLGDTVVTCRDKERCRYMHSKCRSKLSVYA